MLTGNANSGTSNVTDSEVVFPKGTTSVNVEEKTNVKKISGHVGNLQINGGKVGSIDIESGTVEVTDGTVGDIETSGAPAASRRRRSSCKRRKDRKYRCYGCHPGFGQQT
jgi:hypothetical protein